MRSALPGSVAALPVAVEAKANALLRARCLPASIRAGAAAAMVAPSIFFVQSAHRRNTHRLLQMQWDRVRVLAPMSQDAELALVWSARTASALNPDASFGQVSQRLV